MSHQAEIINPHVFISLSLTRLLVSCRLVSLRLYLRGYSGTAGTQSSLASHGTGFSTRDQDNDNCDHCKCALMLTGGSVSPVLSCPSMPCPVLPSYVLSFTFLSSPDRSDFLLSSSVISSTLLSWPFLSCLVLSHLLFSFPVLLYPLSDSLYSPQLSFLLMCSCPLISFPVFL